ncbi:Alpha/Beta hydrolase protein [Mycena epipterygia]|nr:Alpha/Beta hydrolase protein [Mycena epipterygia]
MIRSLRLPRQTQRYKPVRHSLPLLSRTMSFCVECFKDFKHEGPPEGMVVQIGGVKCYLATPRMDYPKNKALLYLPNVFGMELHNNQLLADDFARSGFKTIIPDIMNGDPVSPAAYYLDAPPFDLDKWFSHHDAAKTRPPIDAVIALLAKEGITSLSATGYCFGARYVFDLAFDKAIQVAAVAHPTFLVVPDDLEKYRAKATAPLLMNTCTFDEMFPLEAQAQADVILGGGKFAPGFKREYFEGCTHGFAVRGDMSDPKAKAGKEDAFKVTVEWFLR